MFKVINNHRQPIVLDDGTTLAAAGTQGSVRELESISERDRRRHVERGRIAVEDLASPAPAGKSKAKETKE